jgi:hypothetical protein
MIVSFDHEFIFFKSKKTGGSSVECALAPLCGVNDIVTLAGFDEMVLPGGEARNFTDDADILAACAAGLANAAADINTHFEIDGQLRQTDGWFTHMMVKEVRDRLTPRFWNDAFKFTIERHPYEKAVSQAYYSWATGGQREGEGFDAFFDRMVRRGPYHNTRFYLENGRLALDRVLRYENLEAELGEVAERFGLTLPDPLPRIKGGMRTDLRPARDILDAAQKAAIYTRCRDEFELMGYDR